MKKLFLILFLCSTALAVIHPPLPLVSSKRPAVAGGGSEWTPTNAVWDLDVNQLSGSDGDAIETFSDRSGNAHHFSQGASGQRMILTNSTSFMNGKKTLWGDGANDCYTNKTFLSTATGYTFFFVINDTGAPFESSALFDLADTSLLLEDVDGATSFLSYFDGAPRKTWGVKPDAAFVVTYQLNPSGTAGLVYTNNVACGAAQSFTAPNASQYSSIGQQTGGINTFVGPMARAIMWNHVLTALECSNVVWNLSTNYGTAFFP